MCMRMDPCMYKQANTNTQQNHYMKVNYFRFEGKIMHPIVILQINILMTCHSGTRH